MKSIKVIGLLLFTVLVITFSSCNKSSSSSNINGTSSIVGKWTMLNAVAYDATNGNTTINYATGSYLQFNADGSYIRYSLPVGGPAQTETGKYLVSGTNLILTTTGSSSSINVIINTLDAHTLVLVSSSGSGSYLTTATINLIR